MENSIAFCDREARFLPTGKNGFGYLRHTRCSLNKTTRLLRSPYCKRLDCPFPTEAEQVDHGPEFISKDLDRWAYDNGVTLDFSRPGKPGG